MIDENKIVNAIVEELEFNQYIRDDNLNAGNPYDYIHGVFQGQVQAAERIMTKVLKLIEENDTIVLSYIKKKDV